MSALADHARRGAQEARDLEFRVGRVRTGIAARPASDARDTATDFLRLAASSLDDLAFALDALANELSPNPTVKGNL